MNQHSILEWVTLNITTIIAAVFANMTNIAENFSITAFATVLSLLALAGYNLAKAVKVIQEVLYAKLDRGKEQEETTTEEKTHD